jgi:hypothetical protein
MTIHVATRLLPFSRNKLDKHSADWKVTVVENLDISHLFISEIKSLFTKAKKFIIWSSPIGATIGAVSKVVNSGNSGSAVSDLIPDTLYGAFAAPLSIAGLILLYVIFWFPSIVAKRRGHAYTSMIQVLNIATLFTFITWFIAAGWAIFPSEKSLIDPVVGNPTGLGRRNAGDTIGAAGQGLGRGKSFEEETDKQIQNLIEMRSMGLLSDEEFLKAKRKVLQRDS